MNFGAVWGSHNNRMFDLDMAIFKSEDHILKEYEKITTHPEINKHDIQQKVEDVLEDNTLTIPSEYRENFCQALLLAPFKLNLPIHSQIFITERKKNGHSLDRLLFIACRFLNLHAAKLLIEMGADVNAYHIDTIHWMSAVTITTCLYEATRPVSRKNGDELIEKTKLFVEFLLNQSADPDIKVCWSDERDHKGLRDMNEEEIKKKLVSVR